MTSEGLVTPSKHKWAGKQNPSIFIHGNVSLSLRLVLEFAGAAWSLLVVPMQNPSTGSWSMVDFSTCRQDWVKEVRDVAGGVREGGSGSEP